MGAVFRPKDLSRGHKKIIDNAIKDFTPDIKDKDNVIKVLEGKESKEKLNNIVGQDRDKVIGEYRIKKKK